ncbi:NB-ARC domain-containing protein [Amycolatopsis sp. NPDC003731]
MTTNPAPSQPEPSRPAASTPPVYKVSNSQGVQIGSNNTQYNYNIVTQTSLSAMKSQPAVPGLARARTPESTDLAEPRVRVGVVPLLADWFQIRKVDLDRQGPEDGADSKVLAQTTNEPFAARTTVLVGIGGVGKTQLAAELATRAWHDPAQRLAMWVTADSRLSIIAAYAEAAHRLLSADPTVPDTAAHRLLEWMGSTDQPWLVVLDDLRSPADLRDLWPRTERLGRVVVTTRRRDPALHRRDRVMLPVDVFTPAESLSYLRAKLTTTGTGADLDDGAADLADTLGHLPLALAQAAAYQLDRGLTCHRYRDRFRDHSKKLSEILPDPDEEELPDGYRHTIAVTWSLSVELADRLAPRGLATPMLRIAALLDPAGTPLAAFTTRPVLEYLATNGFDADEDAIVDALGALHRLSLITLEHAQSDRMVAIHTLVQRAVRDTLTPECLRNLARAAADAMLAHGLAHPNTVLALARLLGIELQEVLNDTSTMKPENQAVTEPSEPIILAPLAFLDSESFEMATDVLMAAIALQEARVGNYGPDHPRTMVGTVALGLALAVANQMYGQRESALALVEDGYIGLREAYVNGAVPPQIAGISESIYKWVLGLVEQDLDE